MKKPFQRLVLFTASIAATSAMAAVTFYETPNFGGMPLRVEGTIPDFRSYDYNDRAMSLVVEGAPVEVCVHIYFGGHCQVFNPGQYPHLGVWSGRISSTRPASYQSGYRRRDYPYSGYEQHGYEQRRYDQRTYDQRGYEQRGYEQRSYDPRSQWGSEGRWEYPRGSHRRDY